MELPRPHRVTPQIRRIQAPNPSPMTAAGTNSYLVGTGGALALIDPGPDMARHAAALEQALDPGERIGVILVTHPHLDHSALARPLGLKLDIPVYAFGPAAAGQSPRMQHLAATGLEGGGEGVDHAFAPDHSLRDGQTIAGDWGEIRTLHTPGHMGGHLAFAHQDVLFSGDHAMGWASSLISPPDGDMRDYMASLRRLMQTPWRLMLPGHGAEVRHVQERLAALLDHRLAREAQLRAALQTGPKSALDLAQALYTDSPPALIPAAARNMLAHLIDLMDRNDVTPAGNGNRMIGPDTIFRLEK